MKLLLPVVAALALFSPSLSTDAFVPRSSPAFSERLSAAVAAPFGVTARSMSSTAAAVIDVPTQPIAGMKPGTSGLRKKVDIWQGFDEKNKYYLHNFVQSLLDTAVAKNGNVMLETYVFTLS
jgi:hypothetical protein